MNIPYATQISTERPIFFSPFWFFNLARSDRYSEDDVQSVANVNKGKVSGDLPQTGEDTLCRSEESVDFLWLRGICLEMAGC